MKRLFTIMMFSVCLALGASAQTKTDKMIHRIILSEMQRNRKAWMIDGGKPKWNYTQGLELKAMMDYADTQDDAYRNMIYNYADEYADTLIDDSGRISKYKMSDFKLDAINSGKILFRLHEFTNKKKYRIALDTLRSQLAQQPRTEDGGFWHKTIYPEQMWLDGLYMASPFYAEYAQWYENGERRAMSMDDVEHQFCLIYKHCFCNKCNLLHHAWDADKKQPWADKETGRSAHAWGRAEGWYMMALADYLELYKTRSSKYYAQDQGIADSLVYIFQSLSYRMLELQSPANGAWQQVLDCAGQEGNYYEMSVTPMMAYAYLKGYRLGLLGKSYKKAAIKALRGMEKNFVTCDDEGLVSLHEICIVAGLSDNRNGSFEYYIGEKKGDNDPKGVGPWIMALTELSKIKNFK